MKECKLYDKLDKINPKIELLAPKPSNKNGPTLISIPPISIPSIQINPSLQSFSPYYITLIIACLL